MPVDPRRLFVESVGDLQARMGRSTQYDLIRAAGLLRQLFMDGTRLIDRVNRVARLRLQFPVATADPIGRGPSQVSFRGFGGAATPKYVDRDKFLSYECVSLHGVVFSVADVIRISANKEGGIHYDQKVEPDEDALIRMQFQRYGVELLGGVGPGADATAFVLHQIGFAALAGLGPLVHAVKRELGDNAAGGDAR